MEENAGPLASGPEGCPPVRGRPISKFLSDPSASLSPRPRPAAVYFLLLFGLFLPSCGRAPRVGVMARVASQGKLVYGSDKEGGGPYVFPDPEAPREVKGFEVEIMRALGAEVGVKAEFAQGQWDRLLQQLDA